MKKSDNLILRVDPKLKEVIDNKASKLDVTTSELVREILSVIFLVDYENNLFKQFLSKQIDEQIDFINKVITYPCIEEDHPIKKNLYKNLENCLSIKKAIKESELGSVNFNSYNNEMKSKIEK